MKKKSLKEFRELLEKDGWIYKKNKIFHRFLKGKYSLEVEPSYIRECNLYFENKIQKKWRWEKVRDNIPEFYQNIKELSKW
jgi:CRISPR/Cas system-associated protein endoribonuclease Cas2